MKIDVINILEYYLKEASKEEFIKWAKSYNIFQNSSNQFYKIVCEKIKEKCQKENINIDLIKPEI